MTYQTWRSQERLSDCRQYRRERVIFAVLRVVRIAVIAAMLFLLLTNCLFFTSGTMYNYQGSNQATFASLRGANLSICLLLAAELLLEMTCRFGVPALCVQFAVSVLLACMGHWGDSELTYIRSQYLQGSIDTRQLFGLETSFQTTKFVLLAGILLSFFLLVRALWRRKYRFSPAAFASARLGTFRNGSWSEAQGAIGADVLTDRTAAVAVAKAILNGLELDREFYPPVVKSVVYDRERGAWLVSFRPNGRAAPHDMQWNVALRQKDAKVLQIWYGETGEDCLNP